jgi:hypothetical protein
MQAVHIFPSKATFIEGAQFLLVGRLQLLHFSVVVLTADRVICSIVQDVIFFGGACFVFFFHG